MPAASCSVSQSANGVSFDVKGRGFKPGEPLTLSVKSGSATTVVGAQGTFTAIANSNIGPITAKQEGEPPVTCGTVKEAEQKDAQAQYRKGFRQGLADAKEDCKKEPPKPGVAPWTRSARGATTPARQPPWHRSSASRAREAGAPQLMEELGRYLT